MSRQDFPHTHCVRSRHGNWMATIIASHDRSSSWRTIGAHTAFAACGIPFDAKRPVYYPTKLLSSFNASSSTVPFSSKVMIVCNNNEKPQEIDLSQLPLVQSDRSAEVTPERLRQRLEMGGSNKGEGADGQRFAVLSYEQVKKLDAVMEEVMPIHGRGNFPTLEVRLKDLVKVVRAKLESEQSVAVRDIRLNGGAASHVLAPEASPYNDLDLIFAVDLSNQRNFDKVKTAVLDSLLDFLPEGVVKKRISTCSLKEAYVHKMVKVTNGDRWSLISLSNNRGRNIELKFVDTMRRQFEFSVDSFQIILDSLLLFYGCSQMAMSDNFYPTVVAESVYGDFQEALYHLHKKLIATRNPEEIRGGGLLKYCNLLVRDYKPARPEKIKHLERYMCSRFFIDFGDINQQRAKLESYLANHFMGEEQNKYEYLLVLHRVVDESTVCLMGHERRQSLALIEELACRTYYLEHQAKDLFQPHPHIVFGGGFFFTPYAPYPCPCSWMPCT